MGGRRDFPHGSVLRPSSENKSWTGEGLPPVGAHIEWLSTQYGWLGGRVVGHDGESISVVAHNDGYTGCHPHEIRPIRTAEQIAAEDREKAIAEMADTARHATGFGINLADMAALYDAGYHKQVAPC